MVANAAANTAATMNSGTLIKVVWLAGATITAILALAPLRLGAQSAPTLRGIVVAADGLPIAGARVRAGAARVTTDPQGRFALAILPGAVQVTVTASGFATAVESARAPGTLRVVLAPAPLAESVTVAATARNQAITQIPVLAEVMATDRLQSAAAVDLDSLVRQFTGLDTFRRSSALNSHPTTEGVSLLGTGTSGASRALVLVDNLPLDDPFGGWIDWLRLAPEAIEDVTVVEGGASSLYGNNALSGVVAIETRPPNADQFSLRTGGGGQGTAFADSFTSLGGESLAFALRQRSLYSAGYVPAPADVAGSVDTPAGVTANDWAPELRWIPNAWSMFTLGAEYFGESRNNGTRLENNSTALRQLSLAGAVEAWGTWRGNLFDQSETFASSYVSIAANRDSETVVLDQRVPSLAQGAALDWSAAHGTLQWVAGGSFLHVSAVDNELAPLAPSPASSNDGRQRLGGGFMELEWSASSALSLTGALRADGWRNYAAFQASASGVTGYANRGSHALSPSLGAVWHPHGPLSLRASAYESFRAPTLNELYRPFRLGNVETLANPTLGAERYRGAQAGAALSLSRWQLRATYFDGYIDNVITNVTLSTTPQLITRQRQNLGRVRPRGQEVDGRWQLASSVGLWASYTHLHSVVESADMAALIGRKVANVPSNNASLRLVSGWKQWQFSAGESFGGSEFDDDLNTLLLPSFWSTDLSLGRGFGGRSALRDLAPYVAVENLFNRRYAVELTPTPELNSPRLITAGLRLSWPRE